MCGIINIMPAISHRYSSRENSIERKSYLPQLSGTVKGAWDIIFIIIVVGWRQWPSKIIQIECKKFIHCGGGCRWTVQFSVFACDACWYVPSALRRDVRRASAFRRIRFFLFLFLYKKWIHVLRSHVFSYEFELRAVELNVDWNLDHNQC